MPSVDISDLTAEEALYIKRLAARIEAGRKAHPMQVVTPFIVAQALGKPIRAGEIAADAWAHMFESPHGTLDEQPEGIRKALRGQVDSVCEAIERLQAARMERP